MRAGSGDWSLIVTLITGDRWWTDYQLILDSIRSWHDKVGISLLVHGACRGADILGDKAANKLGIPTDPNPADWDQYGNRAGPIRNRAMLIKHPEIELVIGFHDNIGNSKGTKDMMTVAHNRGLVVCLESHAGTICPWTP